MVCHAIMDRRPIILTLVAGIWMGLAGTWLFFGMPSAVFAPAATVPPTAQVVPVPESIVRPEFFRQVWESAESWEVPAQARVLLLPHHLVAGKQIASLVHSYPKRPSKVFLLSPDHFSQGKTFFTTTGQGFVFLDRHTQGDASSVERLAASVDGLRIDTQPFQKEHGVLGLVPFLSKQWEDIPLVPIMVRVDVGDEQVRNLTAALVEELRRDPQALLISTVDFSHYQPKEVADFHDILAKDVVASVANQEAYRAELDSPGALATGLGVARTLGLGDVKIWAHTNSVGILQATQIQESTSHIVASFAPGEIKPQQALTLFFVGDMMFDRKVAQYAKNDPEYPFALVRGAEDRFFKGMDMVVGNLECPATSKREAPQKEIDFACDPSVLRILRKLGFNALSQANNHSLDQGRGEAETSKRAIGASGIAVFGDQVRDDAQSSSVLTWTRGQHVALLGFNTTDNPLDWKEAEKTIKEIKQKNDGTRIIVFMHWGNEYQAKPNKGQVDTAHRFIDGGVDAVIGGHPHWVQSIESYKGKVIAYSLGNFIFDQEWSKETQQGLAVGLAFVGQGTELHLFPVALEKARPKVLTGEARQERLQYLSSISDASLSSQIQKGIIMLSK